jgi:hypothetical protein
MKNKIILLGLLIGVISFGCSKLYDWNQPDDPEMKVSSTYPLSGEWWVRYFDDAAGTNDVGGGYYPLFTSNTAANDGKEIWITDTWPYTVKCPVNMTSKTFAGNDVVNNLTTTIEGSAGQDSLVIDDFKMNITLGKVIVKGGHSTSGVVTDSIYFAIEFVDDPGTIYYVAGIRRTGFLEDEH